EFFVSRAKQELGRLYLQQNRLAEALALFTELAARDEPGDQEFQAFGLAGQSVVFTMQRNFERAAQVLAQLGPLRNQLKDQRMSQMVLYPLSQTRKLIDQKTAQQFDDWRKTLPPDTEP